MTVGGQLRAPAALPGTHCIGGWVGPRAGLEGCNNPQQRSETKLLPSLIKQHDMKI
jgi:hypothetical protein